MYSSCHVAKYQPVYRLAYQLHCVDLGILRALVGVLSWKCETGRLLTVTLSTLEGIAKKRCIVWPALWQNLAIGVCEREWQKRVQRNVGVKSRGTRVTDSSVTHAALQASGWWLIQHNDEPWWINIGPSSRSGLLSLELNEGRGNSPRQRADTEPRWREDTWGICLFISSHMPYPLQCYSESAQWGIRWMLHQLSEDGRAFLPQEQLTQTSSIEKWFSRSFLGGNKAIFWHFTVGHWTFVALLFSVNTHTHEPNLVCVHFHYFFKGCLCDNLLLFRARSHISHNLLCPQPETVTMPSHYQMSFVFVYTIWSVWKQKGKKKVFDSFYISNSFDLHFENSC